MRLKLISVNIDVVADIISPPEQPVFCVHYQLIFELSSNWNAKKAVR